METIAGDGARAPGWISLLLSPRVASADAAKSSFLPVDSQVPIGEAKAIELTACRCTWITETIDLYSA